MTAPLPRDTFAGLCYLPAFNVLAVGSAIAVVVLSHAVITDQFVDQLLIPFFHPVDVRPGDRIEVGSSGGYRPVLVRHPDGSATDTGELPGLFKHLRLAPASLLAVFVWGSGLVVLARVWPREVAERDKSKSAYTPRSPAATEQF